MVFMKLKILHDKSGSMLTDGKVEQEARYICLGRTNAPSCGILYERTHAWGANQQQRVIVSASYTNVLLLTKQCCSAFLAQAPHNVLHVH